ncbi:hypothetical protein [Streptococcus equinus]|uniref:hypothetical protein n=1 Tax=Streptococcus equinus TaxID=1335 RepID=UPI000406F05D|nr:hypothetical protein [Streptococcus equinus]
MKSKSIFFVIALAFLFLGTSKVFADTPVVAENSPIATVNAQIPFDPGDKYNEWHYQYTAQPYDFYYNPYKGTWKMVQVTSTTDHLVRTIFNGWAKYGPWVPRVYR